MSICAELRAAREASGHPLGQKVHDADRWIASTALRLGIDVVTDDGVIRGIGQLGVIARRA